MKYISQFFYDGANPENYNSFTINLNGTFKMKILDVSVIFHNSSTSKDKIIKFMSNEIFNFSRSTRQGFLLPGDNTHNIYSHSEPIENIVNLNNFITISLTEVDNTVLNQFEKYLITCSFEKIDVNEAKVNINTNN